MTQGRRLCLDDQGNLFVVGDTDSTTLPTSTNAYRKTAIGKGDVFLMSLPKDGPIYLSYIGGSELDWVRGMAIDSEANVYLSGMTRSADFPTTPGAYDTTYNDERDAFVFKYFLDFEQPVANAGLDITIDQHERAHFNGSLSADNLGIRNLTWTFNDSRQNVTLYGEAPSYVFDHAGLFEVVLNVTDTDGNWALDWVNVTVRDITPPSVEAGDSIHIDQHELAVFNGTACTDNVGVVNWTWGFQYSGEWTILFGPRPTFLFDKAGTYMVVLNVTDEAGNWAMDTVYVWVRDITPPVADAGPDLVVNLNEMMTFDGSRSEDNVGILNWTWEFVYEGRTVILDGPFPEFIFEVVGVYDVLMTVADAQNNSASDGLQVNVKDNEPPIADAGPDLDIDQFESVFLDGTASSDNVGIASWSYSFVYGGEERVLDGPIAEFTFDIPGIFSVVLTVTDLYGNLANDTVVVTVRDIVPPVADAGADQVVDQYVVVTIDGSGSSDNVGIITWNWSFEYGGVAHVLEGQTTSFTFDLAGVYEVILNVTDGWGNYALDTINVTVNDITPPIVDVGHDLVVDQHQTVHLDGSGSTDNIGIVEWEWTFVSNGTKIPLAGPAVELIIHEAGEYQFRLSVIDAASNIADSMVNVTVRDITPPSAVAGANVTIFKGRRLTFNGNASEDNVAVVNWTWTIEKGGYKETLFGAVVEHSFSDSGKYEITLVVRDAAGNTDMDRFYVEVKERKGVQWLTFLVVAIVVLVVVGIYIARRKSSGREGTQ